MIIPFSIIKGIIAVIKQPEEGDIGNSHNDAITEVFRGFSTHCNIEFSEQGERIQCYDIKVQVDSCKQRKLYFVIFHSTTLLLLLEITLDSVLKDVPHKIFSSSKTSKIMLNNKQTALSVKTAEYFNCCFVFICYNRNLIAIFINESKHFRGLTDSTRSTI